MKQADTKFLIVINLITLIENGLKTSNVSRNEIMNALCRKSEI